MSYLLVAQSYILTLKASPSQVHRGVQQALLSRDPLHTDMVQLDWAVKQCI